MMGRMIDLMLVLLAAASIYTAVWMARELHAVKTDAEYQIELEAQHIADASRLHECYDVERQSALAMGEGVDLSDTVYRDFETWRAAR